MKKNKAIGVIGGMGPAASAHFYELLISGAQNDYGVKINDEFPEIYLVSIPVPDFISSEKSKSKASKMLFDRLTYLDKLPISFYCMACNTGHLLLEELKKKTKKPFVSLLDEIPKFLSSKKVKRVGLLASPTTIKSLMYQKILKDKGVKLITPNLEDQILLGNIIKETVAGDNLDRNSIEVQKISQKLLKNGAEAILEGCTEIPLIFPKQYLVSVYDSLEILASAVLKKYYLLE